MRSISLVVVVLLTGCGEEHAVVIPDDQLAASAVTCRAIAGPEPAAAAVTQLQPTSDSTFLLVDESAREVSLLDAYGARRWTLAFEEEGPRRVAQLVDAAMAGDSVVVVADAGTGRLLGYRPDGTSLWSVDVGFPVQRVSFAGDRLVVAAIGMDPRIPGLLHEVSAGAVRPLGIPFVTHADALARMFVNSVTLQGYADGRIVAAQQFVDAALWRVGRDGRIERGATPVFRATAEAAGWTPPIPFTDADLDRMAAPVIASTPSPADTGLIYLTRTGRRRSDFNEKAMVRLGPDGSFVSSMRLAFNAVGLVYLAAIPDSLIVVDFDQQWYRCPAPPAQSASGGVS